MTYEELKIEAEKLGYGLIKKRKPMGTLALCTCGKKPKVYYGNFYNTVPFYVMCNTCNRKTSEIMPSKEKISRYEAEFRVRHEWNDMMDKIKGEHNDIKDTIKGEQGNELI